MGIHIARKLVRAGYQNHDPNKVGTLFSGDISMDYAVDSSRGTAKGKKNVAEIISNPFSLSENKVFHWKIESVSFQPDHKNQFIKVQIEIQPVESDETLQRLTVTHGLFLDDAKIRRIDSQYRSEFKQVN